MKRVNEWEKLAKQSPTIQKTKNDVLNGVIIKLIREYARQNSRALDYGCGWGEFAQLLCEEGFITHAFDRSDEMVQLAKNKFIDPTFLFWDEFEKKWLNWQNETFDLVVSNLVLCILTKNEQNEMLKNIKDLMKDDGIIILSFCHPCFDYHTESLVSIRKSPEGAKYNQEFEYEKEIKENGMAFHDLHRSLSYYSKLFKENELAILEISESEIFGSSFFPDFITFVLKKKK
jgi:SAM-dependent methyltransferase